MEGTSRSFVTGVAKIWGGCAWIVGTFADKEAADGTKEAAAAFKKKAVRKVASLIRVLRKETKINLQYALTWELGSRRTRRLHFNMIVGPWVRVEHERLREIWRGERISVEWVQDAEMMGMEAAKPKW